MINIVLCSDDNYAQHLGVAIISILENSENKTELCFHVLENGISQSNKEKIKLISSQYSCAINFYHIKDEYLINFPEIKYLKRSAYLRLFIHKALDSNLKKIIYLDSDVIVLKDIKNLYQKDLSGFVFGAVRDEKNKEILRNYFIKGLKWYFNSGVLLIDFQKWQEEMNKLNINDFVNKYKKYLMMADQDIINPLLSEKCLELEKKYNYDTKHKNINKSPESDIVIFHYTEKIKPWSFLYLGKNKEYYFKYLKLSPWSDFKYPDKNFSNFVKKYLIFLNKFIRNILRPLIPGFILRFRRDLFFKINRDI